MAKVQRVRSGRSSRLPAFLGGRPELPQPPQLRPPLSSLEHRYVLQVLETRVVSEFPAGPFARRLEEQFALRTGARFAVSLSSGTMALVAALRATGAEPLVAVPTLTFAASANAVRAAGARPWFLDIDPISLAPDTASMETARQAGVSAILPVHMFGLPVPPAADFSVTVEDAAQAFGARWAGCPVGTIGRAGCFSFSSGKMITAGEGGAVVTDDPDVASLVSLFRVNGMRGWNDQAKLGLNARLSELPAALALAQLERMDELIDRRAAVAEIYLSFLANTPFILPEVPTEAEPAWTKIPVIVPQELAIRSAPMVAALRAENVPVEDGYNGLHDQPIHHDSDGTTCPEADVVLPRLFQLPTGPGIGPEAARATVRALDKILPHLSRGELRS